MTRAALVALCLALAACGDDPTDSPEDTLVLGDDDDAVPSDTDSDPPAAACGPMELCTRTISDCGYGLDLTQCLGFYDDPTACADMDAYVECNCDCVLEPTCDGYFSCGEACFAQHC